MLLNDSLLEMSSNLSRCADRMAALSKLRPLRQPEEGTLYEAVQSLRSCLMKLNFSLATVSQELLKAESTL
jgi:hypothetical protein